MKSSAHPQSATSLPRAPRDEVSSRSARYLIMMAVRVLCFLLMVFVQPLGWWTWIFGAGAIFLPYIAVVLANAGQDAKTVDAVPPERQLEAHAATTPRADQVFTVREAHDDPAAGDAHHDAAPPRDESS